MEQERNDHKKHNKSRKIIFVAFRVVRATLTFLALLASLAVSILRWVVAQLERWPFSPCDAFEEDSSLWGCNLRNWSNFSAVDGPRAAARVGRFELDAVGQAFLPDKKRLGNSNVRLESLTYLPAHAVCVAFLPCQWMNVHKSVGQGSRSRGQFQQLFLGHCNAG
jgi:hypothetical protein